jgi:hypothetical protein
MPITSQTLQTGTQAQLGAIGQWAGFGFPTQAVPLNGVRQGAGKYWKAQDSSATPGTTRQLGAVRSTNYACLQGQNQGSTYTYTTATSGININLQGDCYGAGGTNGAPPTAGGLALSVQAPTGSFMRINGQCVGGGGGGGQASTAAPTPKIGAAGGVGIATGAAITVYTTGTIAGGGGGGGAGGVATYYSPPSVRSGPGGGGGGGVSYALGGTVPAPFAARGVQGGTTATATTAGTGGNGTAGGGKGGNGGGAGQAGQTGGLAYGQASLAPQPQAGSAGGAAGQKSQGAVTFA